MSTHRIVVCAHCEKEYEDLETARWERGCDVCGKRMPERRAESGCIDGKTINQIQITTGSGTRVTVDACGDCVGNGSAMRKLIALIVATVQR